MYRTDLNEALADAQSAANAFRNSYVVFSSERAGRTTYGRVDVETWYSNGGDPRTPRRIVVGGPVLTFEAQREPLDGMNWTERNA